MIDTDAKPPAAGPDPALLEAIRRYERANARCCELERRFESAEGREDIAFDRLLRALKAAGAAHREDIAVVHGRRAYVLTKVPMTTDDFNLRVVAVVASFDAARTD